MTVYGEIEAGTRDGADCGKAMVVGNGSIVRPEIPVAKTIVQTRRAFDYSLCSFFRFTFSITVLEVGVMNAPWSCSTGIQQLNSV
jgi:hypothetical protein